MSKIFLVSLVAFLPPILIAIFSLYVLSQSSPAQKTNQPEKTSIEQTDSTESSSELVNVRDTAETNNSTDTSDTTSEESLAEKEAKLFCLTCLIVLIALAISIFLSYIVGFKPQRNRHFIPSLWTTIGIGGTFFSLLILILYESDNLIGTDGEIQPENIQLFIRGFSAAFITSIIGITGFISTRIALNLVEAKESIPEYDQKSSNFYLHELLELAQEQRYDIAQIKRGLEASTQELVTRLSDAMLPVIKRMSEEVMTNFSEELQKQSTSLTGSIHEKLKEALEEMVEKLGSIANSLEQQTKDVQQKQNETLSQFLEEHKKFMQEFREMVESTNSSFQKNTNILVEVNGDVQEQLSSSLTDMTKRQYELLEGHSKKVTEVLENIKTETSALHSFMQELQDWQQQTEQAYENLVNRFHETASQYDTTLNDRALYQEEWTKTLNEIKQLNDSLVDLSGSQKEHLEWRVQDQEYLSKMNDSLTHLSELRNQLAYFQEITAAATSQK